MLNKNTVVGVAAMAASVSSFGTMDALGKYVSQSYPVTEVVFFRFAATLASSLLIAYFSLESRPPYIRFEASSVTDDFMAFDIWRRRAVVLRGGLMGIEIAAFCAAFQNGNLVAMYLISFVHPIVFIFLDWIDTGIKPKLAYVMPVAFMMIGVLIPSVMDARGMIGLPGLFSLMGGCFLALSALFSDYMNGKRPKVIGKIDQDIPTFKDSTVLVIGSAASLAILCLVVLPFEEVARHLEFRVSPWRRPPVQDTPWIFFQCLAAVAGTLLFITAQRKAESKFILPFDYLIMIVGALFSRFLFHEDLGWGLVIGCVVLAVAGIWLLAEEAREE